MLLSLSLNPFFTLPIAASLQMTVECHPTHPLIMPVLQPWADVWCLVLLCCCFFFSYFLCFLLTCEHLASSKNINLGCLLHLAVLCLKCFVFISHLPWHKGATSKWGHSIKLILEDVKASFYSDSICGITYAKSCNKLHFIALRSAPKVVTSCYLLLQIVLIDHLNTYTSKTWNYAMFVLKHITLHKMTMLIVQLICNTYLSSSEWCNYF